MRVMRQHHYFDATLEAILMNSTRSSDSTFREAVSSADEEEDIVPQWLADRLQKLFTEIEGESLPEDLVILFRHLNEADHT